MSNLELNSGPIEYCSDIEQGRNIFQELTEAYLSGELIYGNEKEAPEAKFISLLREKESEYPGITLNGLFLVTSLTFAGSTEALFSNLTNEESFENNSWLFSPSLVVTKTEEECIDALMEYVRPTGITKWSVDQWWHNCKYLRSRYDGQVEVLFNEFGGNAFQILPQIQCGKEREKNKSGFRRYGTKLATLFLLWVDQYGLYELDNINSIGIPIDRHVRRFLTKTDILVPKNDIPIYNFTYDLALPMIKEIIESLQDKGYQAWQVMNAIWGLSTNECKKGLHEGCPIEERCSRENHIEKKTKVIAR